MDKLERKVGWNEVYYDQIEYFAWSPDVLASGRRVSGRYRTAPESMRRLRRLENPFNHLFSMFFRLAPSDFLRSLLEAAGVRSDRIGKTRSLGREAYLEPNYAQHDLLFKGPNAAIAAELKIGAKSSIDQMLKYATILHVNAPRQSARRILLYFGPNDFAALWPRRGETVESVKSQAIAQANELDK